MAAGSSNLDIEEDQCEIGYWIAKPYWNKGICTEALQAVVDYCENPASGRVMEKCGFVDTGQETLCPGLEIGGDKPVRVTRLDYAI